jgi:hypothetical protein
MVITPTALLTASAISTTDIAREVLISEVDAEDTEEVPNGQLSKQAIIGIPLGIGGHLVPPLR